MSTVTEPGLYDDIPEHLYHADKSLAPELGRSLSVSGAKLLLDCPAKFAYRRAAGEEHKQSYDFGHVAHGLILGTGRDLQVIDCYHWKLKKHQDAKQDAYTAGMVPLHRGDFLIATRVARAVRRHPIAAAILSEGAAEQSFYWIDEPTGVTLRGRVDWLRDNVIADVKTCQDASPTGFAKVVANFGYHQQAAMYQDGIEAVTGRRLPFVFVCVEKEPPFLVGVYQLDEEALTVGADRNRRAINMYADCESSGVWPGYSSDIETLSLPRWATY